MPIGAAAKPQRGSTGREVSDQTVVWELMDRVTSARTPVWEERQDGRFSPRATGA